MNKGKEKENADISARLTDTLNYLSVTKNAFALKIGYERAQTVYDIINGKSAPSYDFFRRFQMSEYSEIINIDWLLTGRGSMLKTGTTPPMGDKDATFDQSYINIFNRIFEESIPYTRLTFDQFGEYCDIANDRMKKIYMRYDKASESEIGMMAHKLGLSRNWLMTGLGPQFETGKFNKDQFEKEYKTFREAEASKDNRPVAIPTDNPKEGIPLIPVNAMAGALTSEQSVLEYECDRYVVPVFKGADFLIPVKGSSMYPKYSSGDIVACKRVPMTDLFFQWNKV